MAGQFSALYGYDDHGNMISMPHLAAVGWNYRDEMVSADKGGGGIVYFTYDAGGERVRKVYEHNGLIEERIYLGGFEIYRKRLVSAPEEIVLERETLHMMDGVRRIAMVETKTIDEAAGGAFQVSTVTRFQLGNHLGSAALEVDAGGLLISYEEYHPYGTTAYWSASGAVEVSKKRYRYTGKEKDEETGLYYHGSRYYAPWLGRWTAADPSGLVDGANLYAYCHDAPISHMDPDGRQDVSLPDPLAEFSRGLFKVVEFLMGGKAETVGPGANGVIYRPPSVPYGGGVTGGIVLAATFRLWPQEKDPTLVSRAGMDTGAGFVPILDPAARLVTGKTVSKAPTSRIVAGAELVLQVIPVVAEARAGASTLEKQFIDVAKLGTAGNSVQLPPEVQKFLPQAEAMLARRAAPPGGEGVLNMGDATPKPPAAGTPAGDASIAGRATVSYYQGKDLPHFTIKVESPGGRPLETHQVWADKAGAGNKTQVLEVGKGDFKSLPVTPGPSNCRMPTRRIRCSGIKLIKE